MQKILFFLTLLLFSKFVSGQSQSFQLSSHILDVSTGQPAPDVVVELQKMNSDKSWTTISSQTTDENGRIKEMLPYKNTSNDGIYKLVFRTEAYFERKNTKSFYPFIEVVFSLNGKQHFHVPITVSPFGYSTYKGN